MTAAMMSWYRSAVDPVPGGELTLGDLAEKVRTSPKLAECISALRAMESGEGYDEAKRELPCLTPSGHFERRASSGLLEHSGLVVVDLDGLPDLAEAEATRDATAGSPNVALSFVSPSGRGVKVFVSVGLLDGCAVDAGTHGAAFEAAAAHVRELTGCEVDRTGRDVARLCFMSHDPQAKYNPDAEPLRVERPAPREKPAPHPGTLTDAAAWADGAMRAELARVAGSKLGERNATLNQAAYNLGQIVAGGYMDRAVVAARLLTAAELAGLPPSEAARTIASGLDAGEREPRGPADHIALPDANGARQVECARRDAAEREALRQRPAAAPLPWRTSTDLRHASPEHVLWIIPGLAVRKSVTLLAGAPKAGKTVLVFAAIEAMQAERCGLLPDQQPGPPARVLYLTEEGAGTIGTKLRRWQRLDVEFLLLRELGAVGWAEIIRRVGEYAERGGFELVVIDTLAAWTGLRGDDENQAGRVAEAMAPLLGMAEQRNLAVLLLHHSRKDSAERGGVEAVRGSSALTASVDLIAVLQRPDEAGGGERELSLFGRFDDLPEKLRFHIDMETGELTRVGGPGPHDKVLKALAAGPLTAVELGTALGLGEKQARRLATDAVSAGLIVTTGEGGKADPIRWLLADSGHRDIPPRVPNVPNPVIRPEAAEFEGLGPEDSGHAPCPESRPMSRIRAGGWGEA